MTLSEYLTAHNLTPSKFAERLGAPTSTVTRILNGAREPRLETIRRIEAETGGAVTANDFAAANPVTVEVA